MGTIRVKLTNAGTGQQNDYGKTSGGLDHN